MGKIIKLNDRAGCDNTTNSNDEKAIDELINLLNEVLGDDSRRTKIEDQEKDKKHSNKVTNISNIDEYR